MPESTPKLLKVTTHWAINFATDGTKAYINMTEKPVVCMCLSIVNGCAQIKSTCKLVPFSHACHACRFHDAVRCAKIMHSWRLSPKTAEPIVTPYSLSMLHIKRLNARYWNYILKISTHLHDSVCSGLVVFQLLWWTTARSLWWHNSASVASSAHGTVYIT